MAAYKLYEPNLDPMWPEKDDPRRFYVASYWQDGNATGVELAPEDVPGFLADRLQNDSVRLEIEVFKDETELRTRRKFGVWNWKDALPRNRCCSYQFELKIDGKNPQVWPDEFRCLVCETVWHQFEVSPGHFQWRRK